MPGWSPHDRKVMQQYPIDMFVNGMNTDSSKGHPDEFKEGLNGVLTQNGMVKKRGGSETKNSTGITVTSGIGFTSLKELMRYSISGGSVTQTRKLLATAGSNLMSLTPSGSTLTITGSSNIKTNLTVDAYNDIVISQNKAFYANGDDLVWTDGVNAYDVGIEQPVTAPTEQAQVAGNVLPGIYKYVYAYARSTEEGFYGLVTDDSVQVTVVTSNKKVTIRCVASNNTDTSSDKIYLFRTLAGPGVEYYKVAEAANPNDGSNVDIEDNTADASIDASTDGYLDNHNEPPAGIRFMVSMANRMFYADYHKIYFSDLELPECVNPSNKVAFEKNDGELIAGIGKILNYLVIFKKTKTYIFDASNPTNTTAKEISNSIGCDSFRTIKSVENGQMLVWLSLEGFAVTDGSSVFLLSRDKIGNDLSANRDFSKNIEAFAEYYPKEGFYVCHVPYKSNSHKIWTLQTRALEWEKIVFMRQSYTFEPTCFGMFINENEEKRWVAGKVLTTNGYLIEMDMDGSDDDGEVVSSIYKLNYNHMGAASLTKSFRGAFLEVESDLDITLRVTLGLDGSDGIFSDTVTNKGAVSFDEASQGFDDDEVGMDQSGEDIVNAILKGKGRSFSIEIRETSTVQWILKSMQIAFRATSIRREFIGKES